MVRRKSGQDARRIPEALDGKAGQREPRTAFDIFLDRGLHSMFDSIKDEPIPEDLLRIIQEDRQG